MTKTSGISAPIYKIDVEAAVEHFGGSVAVEDLPEGLVADYNEEKGIETFRLEGSASVGDATFMLYRNVRTRPNTSGWVKFFSGSGIELGNITNQLQHLVCFVAVDGELYAYTAGQSAVVFERFTDVSFPVEVGRRIAQPKVKAAKANQITGTTLASDMHFRDPRRITYSESLDTVWTSLSGKVQDAVMREAALTSIFGPRSRMRLDVTSAIKLGPSVESPERMLELIRWLADKADAPLPADDGWAPLDAIKILNPRKKKYLIERLRSVLAQRIFVDREFENLAVAHVDATLYDNATRYLVTQGRNHLYDEAEQPDLSDIVASMDVNEDDLVENFSRIQIRSSNEDYGSSFGTSGSLLGHLHGELQFEGKTYFLLAGKWYEVDAAYIEQVTKDFTRVIDALDLAYDAIGLRAWGTTEVEGDYNETSLSGSPFINGDKVLTDNVELFDTLTWDDKEVRILHVKRGFNVKVRDVRSQLINSAQIIENDLRTGSARLKDHYRQLFDKGRTKLSEEEFIALFSKKRVYVLAYGAALKVTPGSLSSFRSSVARMEVVSMNAQFRQISSADSQAELRITWIPVSD